MDFREQLQTTTVWSFPKRGIWATHDSSYRGNWAPQVPRNLIERYSKSGDFVLDPMVGAGTTLIECKLLNRNALGIDINPNAVKLTKARLCFASQYSPKIDVALGDARRMVGVPTESVDLLLMHPPYLDIVRYSDGQIEGDISNHSSLELFKRELRLIATEAYRVLRPNRYCAILTGDVRKRGVYIPLGFEALGILSSVGFILKESVIKLQHNCRSSGFWEARSRDFLLIMHENLLVFRKPEFQATREERALPNQALDRTAAR